MPASSDPTNASKTARVEIKTTNAAKDLIRRAAALSGLDMTAFIMASAFERAEQVLERHHRIELSAQAFTRLQAVLVADETVQPNQALIDLMSLDNASRPT